MDKRQTLGVKVNDVLKTRDVILNQGGLSSVLSHSAGLKPLCVRVSVGVALKLCRHKSTWKEGNAPFSEMGEGPRKTVPCLPDVPRWTLVAVLSLQGTLRMTGAPACLSVPGTGPWSSPRTDSVSVRPGLPRESEGLPSASGRPRGARSLLETPAATQQLGCVSRPFAEITELKHTFISQDAQAYPEENGY